MTLAVLPADSRALTEASGLMRVATPRTAVFAWSRVGAIGIGCN